MRDQLSHLIFPGFLTATPFPRLLHLPRYLQAIVIRRRKLMNAGVPADTRALAERSRCGMLTSSGHRASPARIIRSGP